jgi:adenylate kinase family enzyme
MIEPLGCKVHPRSAPRFQRSQPWLAAGVARSARSGKGHASACAEAMPRRLSFVRRRCVSRRRKPERHASRQLRMAAALDYMRRGDLVPDSTVWEMVRGAAAACIAKADSHWTGSRARWGRRRPSARGESHAKCRGELRIAGGGNRVSPRRPQDLRKVQGGLSGQEAALARQRHLRWVWGRRYQHEDDRPELVRQRLEVYENSTAPLIQFSCQLGLLVSVAAAGSLEEICARTMSALEKRLPVGIAEVNSALPQRARAYAASGTA